MIQVEHESFIFDLSLSEHLLFCEPRLVWTYVIRFLKIKPKLVVAYTLRVLAVVPAFNNTRINLFVWIKVDLLNAILFGHGKSNK